MIELETTARIRAVQFPAPGSMLAQTDVHDELARLGITAKLYDGEFVGDGWRSMALQSPTLAWTPWVKPGQWIIVMTDGDNPASAVIVVDDADYRAMFRPKREHRAVVATTTEAMIEAATGDDHDTSWASDMELEALEPIGDLLYIGGQYSIDVRQLVEDVLRSARA